MKDNARKIDCTLVMEGANSQAKQFEFYPQCNEGPTKAFEKDGNVREVCYLICCFFNTNLLITWLHEKKPRLEIKGPHKEPTGKLEQT